MNMVESHIPGVTIARPREGAEREELQKGSSTETYGSNSITPRGDGNKRIGPV